MRESLQYKYSTDQTAENFGGKVGKAEEQTVTSQTELGREGVTISRK
jgi:hypothetical protein